MTEIDGEILSKITQIRGFEKGIRRFLDSGDVGIVLLRDMMKELDEMSIQTNSNEVLDEIRKLQSDMRGYKRIIREEEKPEEDEEIIKIQSKLSMCGIKIKLIRDDKGVLHLKNLQSVDKIVFDIGLVNNGKVRVSRYNFSDKNVKLDITNLDFELQTNFEYRSIFRGLLEVYTDRLLINNESLDKMCNVVIDRIKDSVKSLKEYSNKDINVANTLVINTFNDLLNIINVKGIRKFGSMGDDVESLCNSIVDWYGNSDNINMKDLDKVYTDLFDIASISMKDKDINGYNKKTAMLIKDWNTFYNNTYM